MELTSSGEGLMWPAAFSGVPERTTVGPGPAVAGLSPRGPEGSIPCRLVSGDLLLTGVAAEVVRGVMGRASFRCWIGEQEAGFCCLVNGLFGGCVWGRVLVPLRGDIERLA